MEKKWNQLCYSILSGLLALLGFSACGNIIGGDECLYGTPTAKHEIKGKVTAADEGNAAIPNIEVVVVSKFLVEQAQKYGVDISGRGLDTLYTDTNGEFSLERGGTSAVEEYRIYYNDIDGEEHGGVFASDSTDVKLEQTEKGDGSWYHGKGAATTAIGLKR